ncbi:unnamed protein product [Pieris brassicae]|uniref:Dystrophin n=1 Tax=Pieris brassicae TaxID=7116 RepID=A0A9P0THU5_PIEBR|nr:unnamed protein product [Pieris brassicae]
MAPSWLTALREHWDEANARVLQRKAQLDAMLGDSQRYEARRRDADAWLSRMETRLAAMTAPGHTADVLEMQLREQKSFHAEVHQYKHQVELFGQLTQRLIAVYRNDDTTRIKRATEAINHRYNELNNSIIARGKALHSAVSSLQNFDRSLEKFVAWLSEAESLLDAAERDPHLLKVSYSLPALKIISGAPGDASFPSVGRRTPCATHASRHVTLPAAAMTEGAGRPRPAPPRKPDSLTLAWPRWDDPPPPAPDTKPPHPITDDFGGFSPYTPPNPIQPERRPRRPQSVVSPRQIPEVARRPHSLGSIEDEWPVPLLQPVPRRPVPTVPARAPFLPSSRSDYQLQRPAIMTNGYGAVPPSTSRRLSLPGGGQNPPKMSATFHGLSALMGVHPPMGMGTPMGTPMTPSTPAAVREAVRHLLQQPRNGFPIMDHKLSLFIDILDAQERFSQVILYSNN